MHWRSGGKKLITKSLEAYDHVANLKRESEPSKIPGHPFVQEEETIISEFVAFVADMRDSSKHLLCNISDKSAKVSNLQRVYYETSALLPAIAKTVSYEMGAVTEYLGDGLLALFEVDENDKSKAVYAAHRAARNSINTTLLLINESLNERYKLPNIQIGIGLAISNTLVTLVGINGEKHPKAIGECIYRASKLSGEANKILIDTNFMTAWPKSKSGSISFIKKVSRGVEGYTINTKK